MTRFDRSLKLGTCQLYWLSALCVAGCTQESAWRGVMRSLDNFFKAASNNHWCEGAWPPQLARTRGGKRGRLIRSVYDPVRISCIVKFETWELWDQSKLEPPTLSGSCISTPLSHAHGILINPPKLSEGEESKCTWQSGRGNREAVGVIKSDLATDPPSQLKTGDLRRQVEPTIGSLLLSEEWTCASVSARLFLDKSQRKLWRQAHSCPFFSPSSSWKKL